MRRAKIVELPLVPGALTDDTDLVAKLQATDMDKVRARGNRWETIKGWEAFNASGLTAGTARGIHQWSTLTGLPVVLAASESAINAWINGSRLTITPKWDDVFLWQATMSWSAGSNPTVSVNFILWDVESESTTFTPTAHNLEVGDSITISGVTSAGGGITASQLNSTFTVASLLSTTGFTFVLTGATASGSGSTSFSAPFNITVAMRSGLATGTSADNDGRTRVWSIANFGENAVFCGSDGTPVFYWQPASSYSDVLSGVTASGGNWTDNGGGSFTHSGASEDELSWSGLGDLVTPGKTYLLSFTLSSVATNATLRVEMGGPDAADRVCIYPEISTNTSGGADRTYTARIVAPPVTDDTGDYDMMFFGVNAVTVSAVTLTLLSIAHRITEAPAINNALFVDGNRVLHLLGSVEADGDYNPLLHRWSDQDNYREWIPDTDNISGEQILGTGSYAVCGAQVGDVNLILSDDGAFVSSFTSTGYNLRQIGVGCGSVGPRALAPHNGRAFWASQNGFHAFDGAQVLTIECPLKDKYVGKLAQYQENKTFAWINSEYGELWVHYPHTSDGTETSRYLIFNFVEKGNPWSFGTLNRTCMVRASAYKYPIGIDASDNIWLHEKGTGFSGSGITLPFVQTGWVMAGEGDRWFGCRRYYPDVKNQTGNIEFTVTGKRSPQGQNTTQTIGPLILQPDAPKMDFMIAARQLKFKWASETSTTQWRLGVVGLELITERERQ